MSVNCNGENHGETRSGESGVRQGSKGKGAERKDRKVELQEKFYREELTDVLASLELLVLLAGEHTERVSTEVITLSLEDVGGDDLGPVAIEEGKSGGEGGRGDTPKNGLGNHTPPAGLRLVHGCETTRQGEKRVTTEEGMVERTLVEEVVKEEGLELRLLLVR